MRRPGRHHAPTRKRLAALAALLLVCAVGAAAQSSDAEFPTPVFGGEIEGRIAPLDIGDARLTRHFYSFGGRPGDLEVTVETNNLEGDVDIFTAAGLRPLAKVTLYAGLNSAVTRTVYLRRSESLVLRVQARTPNDTDGTYRIRFGGTFTPAEASAADSQPRPSESAAAGEAAARPPDRKGRRVTSVGARIEEPRVEVAAEPPAKTEDERAEDARAAESPEPSPTPAARQPAGRTRTPARAGSRTDTARRGTTGSTRRGSTRTPPARPTGEDATGRTEDPAAARPETAEASPAPTPAGRARNPRTRNPRGTTRRTEGTTGTAESPTAGTGARSEESPAAPAAMGLELPGARLVLELREGGRMEREMSGVRRVTVERGLVVIVLKSGKIERQPLSNVLRMSIEP